MCDRIGLIGKTMFAIDAAHQAHDEHGHFACDAQRKRRMYALRREARSANITALSARGIAVMISDDAMRQRDERVDNAHHKAKGDAPYDKTAVKAVKFFGPEDFEFNDDRTATCPAGHMLSGSGSIYGQLGHRFAHPPELH
jgi:hypothetical protein